jgi:3-deoxy-manno-octulosonate cytidylyltransferase (CMP-KDO synthetase)
MVVAVIPSRFQSTRFPGKALVPIGGIPLVVRVARQVERAQLFERVVVTTDDGRIAAAVEEALPRVQVWRSSRPFRTGSDRVAAAVKGLDLEADAVLNVQGDEPLVTATILSEALAALKDGDIGTVAVPIRDRSELDDPDRVKVGLGRGGLARAFSRGPLDPPCHAHVGVYSFTASSLARFAQLPTSEGEQREGLEQLRALDNGLRIGVRLVDELPVSVNRPVDVARAEARL